MEKNHNIGKLLGNVCRVYAKKADQLLDDQGLFRGQAFLLILLSNEEGLTHSEIAERLEISPAAVTKVIKRLEQQGYIIRQPDDTDERVSRVFMLEKGVAKIQEIFKLLTELNQTMLSDFSDEETEEFYEYLVRAQKNLQSMKDV